MQGLEPRFAARLSKQAIGGMAWALFIILVVFEKGTDESAIGAADARRVTAKPAPDRSPGIAH